MKTWATSFWQASIGQTSARFAIVGLICAVAHNVIVIGASLAQVHYAVACVISYVLVVVLGFVLHVRFTFQETPTWPGFWRYAIGMAANYPITLALLFAMCDLAGWPVAVASPVATVLLVAWNFLASRWALARKPNARPPASPSRPA